MNTKFTTAIGSMIILCLFSSIQLYAQCTDNNHSTHLSDAWLSCQTSANPNTSRGNTHWVMYDLGYEYDLGTARIWNYNVENETEKGFKNVAIDYSLDGIEWTEAIVFQLPEASGNSDYMGFSGLDLTGTHARYVLITGLSTWGNGDCGGISEVRFAVVPPNPPTCGDAILVGGNINPISEGVYYSDNEILLDGTVEGDMNVSFQSASSIVLEPGFTAKDGSRFLGVIEPCETSEPSIEQAQKEENKDVVSVFKKNENPEIEVKKATFNLTLFPNPVGDFISLKTSIEVREVVILNGAGREIYRTSPKTTIDISYLPSGIYLLKAVSKSNEVVTQRFVKR